MLLVLLDLTTSQSVCRSVHVRRLLWPTVEEGLTIALVVAEKKEEGKGNKKGQREEVRQGTNSQAG